MEQRWGKVEKMNDYTPGPWEIEGPIAKPGEMFERGYQVIRREPDGPNDLLVAVTGNRADAVLIANAPKLVDLLCRAIFYVDADLSNDACDLADEIRGKLNEVIVEGAP